jgi:DNA topoisomerase-2
MDIKNAYRKQTHREHILSLPDTYIGSIETANEDVFLQDFKQHNIPVNPGFYKLVDELLVNAHDHVIRMKQRGSELVKHIDIECTPELFSVENDGKSIDVAKHPEYDMYVPQLIFGELLTSTNYDKAEKKLVGGKNGYGVKLVNIFAKKMDVKIVDSERKLLYTQTFSDNMTKASVPKVVASKSKSSVKLSWFPDFARFGFKDAIPEPMINLIQRRVWDLAMTVGKEVKVTWNGELIKCRSLMDYAKAYECDPVIFETPNDRWQIAITDTPTDKFFHMSFVNGIWTSKGGTHVDAVASQVVSYIVDYLETKKKIKIKPGLVRDNLGVFIVSLIENPSFTSQTKETLTTKSSAFGSSYKLSEETLKKVIAKLSVVTKILESQSLRDAKDNSKTDGKKQSRITGIPKLDDAVYAGTAQSSKCTLILTEGDSAKSMALSGLSQQQRQFFGVYPLKGKVLNVKDTSDSKVEQTKEIAELKKIMGLVSGKKYTDTSSLRYGSILIMTDQDYDGSHIRGLLINLFHELWHELIKIPGFLSYMATPIVKATKNKETKVFYSQYEYEQWRKTPAADPYKVKYYKGLGTSTSVEAKEYFAHVNAVKFDYNELDSDKSIDLAFNKSRADDRKEWLKSYDRSALIPAGNKLPYTDFINKDLIHFSYYNLERSIPNVMDGLKTSQRKILYAAFKRNLVSEIKVAQFAGYVSEQTGYHHGEASLNETIIGMAQDFMGSNNINWFVPAGQFGTRLQGGKDAASPRYIHTYLQPKVRKLLPAEDFSVLKYRDDDGTPVEPEWYAPILPMLLVNGSRGIGTGYSTYIPPCEPKILKQALVFYLCGTTDALKDAKIHPWFAGFKGKIDDDGTAVGVYNKIGDEFVVTELPPGTWTADYREWLEKMLVEGSVKEFTDTSTDVDINIRIKGISEPLLIKSLTEKIKTTNMHAFNHRGIITKYATLNDILIEYADVRLSLYEKRRLYQIADMKERLPFYKNIVRFIRSQCEKVQIPDLRRKTLAECDDLLAENKYEKIKDSYDYIMRLPISSFTAEVIAKNEKDMLALVEGIDKLEKSTASGLWLTDLQSV